MTNVRRMVYRTRYREANSSAIEQETVLEFNVDSKKFNKYSNIFNSYIVSTTNLSFLRTVPFVSIVSKSLNFNISTANFFNSNTNSLNIMMFGSILLLSLTFFMSVSSFKNFQASRHRFSLSAQKFDSETFIRISLMKPFGLSLEEVQENGKRGVLVDEVNDGSAKESGKVRKGLFLVSADEQDLKYQDFDTILDVLRNSPEDEPVDLVFVDLRNVYRGPAVLTVEIPNEKTIKISSLKGQNMRDILMEAGVEVYGDRAKLVNCGGSGQCGTCAVLVNDAEDWESRSELEGLRLKKYAGSSRLSCLTAIEGDCTITTSPPKSDYNSASV